MSSSAKKTTHAEHVSKKKKINKYQQIQIQMNEIKTNVKRTQQITADRTVFQLPE